MQGLKELRGTLIVRMILSSFRILCKLQAMRSHQHHNLFELLMNGQAQIGKVYLPFLWTFFGLRMWLQIIELLIAHGINLRRITYEDTRNAA